MKWLQLVTTDSLLFVHLKNTYRASLHPTVYAINTNVNVYCTIGTQNCDEIDCQWLAKYTCIQANRYNVVAVANREHYSWAFTSAITTEKRHHHGKKHQYHELEGFNNYKPLINDDKDVNNRPNINNQLITPWRCCHGHQDSFHHHGQRYEITAHNKSYTRGQIN